MAAKIEIIVEANVNQFTPAMNKAGQALTNLQKNSNSAQLALVNLGRVAQDAPYGFIGIANNLNPLLEGFQRLKAESGSTGGALKALGSSLMGAGGIGVALSLVTAAISFASIGFSSWTRGLKNNSEQLDANAELIKKNADAYKSIVSSIAEEVASVSVLIESFKKLQQEAEEELKKISVVGMGQEIRLYQGEKEIQLFEITFATEQARNGNTPERLNDFSRSGGFFVT